MIKRHNERCKDCKKTVEQFLSKIFGSVTPNHNLNLPSRLDEYCDSTFTKDLAKIHTELQKNRGYENFVRSKKLSPVDFFVPAHGIIVEFDESQHFSEPRRIALDNYPDSLALGYDRSKWITLCRDLNKKDPDPQCIFRDEQRAWYDTLRDFAPSKLGLKPVIRIYARELPWCTLNVNSKKDVLLFSQLKGRD